MNPGLNNLAIFNIGGGEFILILVLLFMLGVAAVAVCALIYFIVRAALNRPGPVPSTVPPELALQNQQRRDREHLKLLSIFHFVFAGLALLGIGFLFVHYAVMHSMFSNPQMWRGQPMPPREFLDAFIWIYVFFGLILVAASGLNLLSGLFLWHRQYRVFSLVIGGLNCLQIPFGTALGVFTFVVLSRDSVLALYSAGTQSTGCGEERNTK